MVEITFKTFYFYKNLKGAHCLESPMYSNLKVVFKCIDVILFLGDFYPSISSILGTSCSMERWNFIAYLILIYFARWEEYTLKWYICSIHLLIHFLGITIEKPLIVMQIRLHLKICKQICKHIYIQINYMYIYLMCALLHLRIKFCSQKSFPLVFIFISMLLPFDAKKHFGDIILR